MKWWMMAVLAVCVMLSGCATIADRMGLAKREYADQQAVAAEERATAAAQASLEAVAAEVRGELKKVTWPACPEVYSTTLVVIATSVFFGFYLWGLDLAMSQVLTLVLKR